jgi:hypothetical protein
MQDRYRQIDEILLRRTAGPYIGSFASNPARFRELRYPSDSDRTGDISWCRRSANNGHWSFYSITSSARASSDEGRASPSAFAV